MCGITGAIAFTEKGNDSLNRIDAATACLLQRGPDSSGLFQDRNIRLGHTRLSIIDTSRAASQPMSDASGRFTIVFNGEFYNFKEHRQFVIDSGCSLKSESDTEVLLYLYILEGEQCLERINGFFAFAIYDRQEQSVFIARDRMGIKPLYYFQDADRFLFGSELKSLMALGIPKELDQTSLFTYLQLNYIPGPYSIFKNVRKLAPGYKIKLNLRNNTKVEEKKYYEIPFVDSPTAASEKNVSYPEQQIKLRSLLDASVARRLISDVPLGSFLSGGLDSSVIAFLASQHTRHLRTFSIGFRDEPLFDETAYASLVAKKCGTDHTVIPLSNDDLYKHLFAMLDYTDEPFADSSALNVFILSKETRKQVTVALSGDGADELFGGYNKHEAEWKARSGNYLNGLLKFSYPLLKRLPQSRNSSVSNLFRQAVKMGEGLRLNAKERYWRWASFESEAEVFKLIEHGQSSSGYLNDDYRKRKADILQSIRETGNLNDVLYTDMNLVLVNDMLVKVDRMSMANSLEVRVPFLDYTVVDFAFSLPAAFKIDQSGRKKILRDTFRKDLPEEIYSRPKKGFEVPLLMWLRHELRPLVDTELLSRTFVEEQGLFNYESIRQLKKKLDSPNPGDSAARIWGLVVFQYWWKKWM